MEEKSVIVNTKNDTGMTLVISYLADSHQFEVVVTKGTEERKKLFDACYEPIFGIDISDHNQAFTIAEELAAELDLLP